MSACLHSSIILRAYGYTSVQPQEASEQNNVAEAAAPEGQPDAPAEGDGMDDFADLKKKKKKSKTKTFDLEAYVYTLGPRHMLIQDD